VYDAQIDLVFYINVAEPTPARVGIGGSAVGLMSFFFDKFAYIYMCIQYICAVCKIHQYNGGQTTQSSLWLSASNFNKRYWITLFGFSYTK